MPLLLYLKGLLFKGSQREDQGILAVGFYSDKSHVSLDGYVFYPVLFFFPGLPREEAFKRGLYLRLGYIPVAEVDKKAGLTKR